MLRNKGFEAKKIKNSAGENILTIEIFEEIDSSWWGVSSQWVADEIRWAGDITAIDVFINSPGGSVFEGIAIYNLLKFVSVPVNTYILGWAASIASIIALSGANVYIGRGAMYMIHEAWLPYTSGDADDLRKDAETLDRLNESLVSIYVAETSLAEQEVRDMMSKETWFTAEEAISKGFADGYIPDEIALSLEVNPEDLFAWDWVDKEFTARYQSAPAAIADKLAKKKTQIENKGAVAPEINNSNDGGNVDISNLTADQLRAQNPKLYNSIIGEGVQQERNRVEAHFAWDGMANAETVKKNVLDGTNLDQKVLSAYSVEHAKNTLNAGRIKDMKAEQGLEAGEAGEELTKKEKVKPQATSNVERWD